MFIERLLYGEILCYFFSRRNLEIDYKWEDFIRIDINSF